ncbi:MAG: DUF2798 domain-containing protein [Hymenobacteraceae bacterium]|nr:DUF2798 domain-containing protein [Hymenobacteraceae bacterium]MDX5480420.1 DUF2798 domain-containing protein [Hymenobacteraceae bacterium]
MRKQYLKPHLKRRLIVIAAISLLLASALQLYTFGITADFFGRWFRAFFVFFALISVTVLAIIPAVNYGVNKTAGR